MTVHEFFHSFDEAKYAMKISEMQEDELRALHNEIRKKVIGAVSSAATGGTTTVLTGPVGLAGVGIGLRRQSYNRDKQRIIENRMRENGWEIHKLRKRDVLSAVGPPVLSFAVAPVPLDAIGDIAGHGAHAILGDHAETAIRALTEHYDQFLHAMVGGAVDQTSAVASEHMARLGYIAGQAAVFEISKVALSTGPENTTHMSKEDERLHCPEPIRPAIPSPNP
ncbi:hypothetical protein ABW20_dc0108332 [Dactylellina cionopaga]|nr:hypothetical protein ABW20_dc0108332 [Dactylellina cionopaga]